MRNTKIVLFELMLCLLVIYGIFILNKKANELNMSSVDVLNSEYCEEIYLQHTIQFTPNNKTFITSQYKDYLV